MSRFWLMILFCVFFAAPSLAENHRDMISEVHARDSAPQNTNPTIDALLNQLRSTQNEQALKDILIKIGELGRVDSNSPTRDKQYIRTHAPAFLRQFIQDSPVWSLRGQAIMLHQLIEAPRQDVIEVIALTIHDNSKAKGYIRSRAELLQAWQDQRPVETIIAQNVTKKTEEAIAESKAKEEIEDEVEEEKQKQLELSVAKLMQAARRGDADEVEELLDAGLSANVNNSEWISPLAAASLGGCARSDVPLTDSLATVDLLLKRGAKVDVLDGEDNSILLSAMPVCSIAIIERLLEAGAKVNLANKQKISALESALKLNRINIAELLVAHGARIEPTKLELIFPEPPTDPRLKALLANATTK